LRYFTSWAAQNDSPPERVLEVSGSLLPLLQRAVEADRAADAIRLARQVEGAFALSARWDAWAQVLQSALTAARACGDTSTEAWALHQIGTRSGCLGDLASARDLLTQAYHIRLTIPDQAGADITRHNFQVLFGAPPPPPKPERRSTTLRIGVGLFAVMLVVLVGRVASMMLKPTPPVILKPTPPVSQPTLLPDVTPQVLDFGRANWRMHGSTEKVHIANRGGASLRIRTAEITGADANDYEIVSGMPSNTTVEAGNVHTILIRFRPQAVGTRRARLRILYDADKRLSEVALTGVGTSQRRVKIQEFRAAPPRVLNGQAVTLSYRIQDARGASVTPGVGPLSSLDRGQLRVQPSQQTTYTLTATGFDGQTVSRSVTVSVENPVRILAFSAVDEAKDTARLAYRVINARSLDIEPGFGQVQVSEKGLVRVTPPPGQTTYTLTATGFDGQTVSRSVTVMRQNAGVRILAFSPRELFTRTGRWYALIYRVENARSVSITPEGGEQKPRVQGTFYGNVRVTPPPGQTTYTLTATGFDGQTVSQSVTISAKMPPSGNPGSSEIIR
jgi:hypothetical protein